MSETQNESAQGVAIIGAGMIGAAHAAGYRAYQPRFAARGLNLHLSTVCDAREPAARALATRYGFERTATDWASVLADDGISIISVCLPNFAHAEVVSAALRAGKHVLCEKPLALSAALARNLSDLATTSRLVAGTVFNYRRFPAVAEVRDLVKAGEIGEPTHLLIQYQAEYAADPGLPHSWRDVRESAGGGALIDVGTHAIDAARFLCGEVAEVRGAVSSTIIERRYLPAAEKSGHEHVPLSGDSRPVDTDDVTTATLLFESGCQGMFSASRVAVGLGNTLSFVLCGTRGTIRYTSERPGEYQVARMNISSPSAFTIVVNRPASPYASDYLPVPHDGVPVGYAEAFGFMIAEFLASIASKTPLANGSFEDGLKAAEALEAIQRSAELRRPVALGEIRSTEAVG